MELDMEISMGISPVCSRMGALIKTEMEEVGDGEYRFLIVVEAYRHRRWAKSRVFTTIENGQNQWGFTVEKILLLLPQAKTLLIAANRKKHERLQSLVK